MAALTIRANFQSNVREIALRSLAKLPPFSPILNMLLARLSLEDVSFARIAGLIEQDPVLAGNVLGLVNSAMFGRWGRVNSIPHAVSLLGVDKLRNAALSMSIARLWGKVRTPFGWSMSAFNQHSIATAILADRVSQDACVSYPEGAFVAGLLHDVGSLLLAISVPDTYAQIQRVLMECTEPLADIETSILGFTHADLSGETMRAWNLPEPIQNAVRYHPYPERDPTRPEGGLVPLSYLIAAADDYVNRAGYSVAPRRSADQSPSSRWFGVLGVEDILPRILEEFHAEFDEVRTAV